MSAYTHALQKPVEKVENLGGFEELAAEGSPTTDCLHRTIISSLSIKCFVG